MNELWLNTFLGKPSLISLLTPRPDYCQTHWTKKSLKSEADNVKLSSSDQLRSACKNRWETKWQLTCISHFYGFGRPEWGTVPRSGRPTIFTKSTRDLRLIQVLIRTQNNTWRTAGLICLSWGPCKTTTAFNEKNIMIVWDCFAIAVLDGTTNSALHQEIVRPTVLTSSWSPLGFCSRTFAMIWNTIAVPQLNGWNETKWRVWSDLVKAWIEVWLRYCGMTLSRLFLFGIQQQSCNEEWARIPPQRCERLIANYCNAWLQELLLTGGASSY